MAFLVFRGCIYFLSARAEFGAARIRLRDILLSRGLFETIEEVFIERFVGVCLTLEFA